MTAPATRQPTGCVPTLRVGNQVKPSSRVRRKATGTRFCAHSDPRKYRSSAEGAFRFRQDQEADRYWLITCTRVTAPASCSGCRPPFLDQKGRVATMRPFQPSLADACSLKPDAYLAAW